MGQTFSSEPVIDKETERDHNDKYIVAVSSCQGWRMTQEDNHSMILELPGEQDASFFAVYDGHGSAKVSKHASENLWRHIVENDMYQKGNFKEALEQSFLTFDKEVNESYNAQLAGTTAVCLLIANDKIYCANIGDSRAVACVNCECIPMSYDHKPENPQELKRIIAAGGYVIGNRINGNLALSRAFGDFHYKNRENLPPEEQVVSPCPDIKTLALNDDVDFLVLACDGIWDVLSSEEVVEFVISRLEESMEPGLICEQLTTRCLATDYELVIGCDNMTVLLVCYTRGRSWDEYTMDIFQKNCKRKGESRFRPTPSKIEEVPSPASGRGNESETGREAVAAEAAASAPEEESMKSETTEAIITSTGEGCNFVEKIETTETAEIARADTSQSEEGEKTILDEGTGTEPLIVADSESTTVESSGTSDALQASDAETVNKTVSSSSSSTQPASTTTATTTTTTNITTGTAEQEAVSKEANTTSDDTSGRDKPET